MSWKRHHFPCAATLFAAALIAPAGAHAITISAAASYQRIDAATPGAAPLASQSANDAGPPPDTVTAVVTPPTSGSGFSGPATVRAAQNTAGFNGVLIDSAFADPQGAQPRDILTATATFSETVTNTTGAAQRYAYGFFLSNVGVALADFAGAGGLNPFDDPTSGAIGGLIDLTVTLDGATIFRSNAEVFGGAGALTVDTSASVDGVGLDGAPVAGALVETARVGGDGTTSRPSVSFETFFATLDLGSLADGDSVTLEAVLTAQAIHAPFELGARVTANDPNNLFLPAGAPTGFQTGVFAVGAPVAPIPLPPAAALLLGGLAALGAASRRRR